MSSTTEKMLALMRRLKIEMNGAVTDAMRGYGGGTQRGYGLNYGVSLPTIKEVARGYESDHELAMMLWRQDVRELKLAALFVDDPSAVTADQMAHWSESWQVAELAEQSAMQLFWRTPMALIVATEWTVVRQAGEVAPDLNAEQVDALRRLAGFYMLGRLAADSERVTDAEMVTILKNEAIFGVMATERSAVYALREMYRHRAELRDDVLKTLESMPLEVASEVRWQIEYLT